MPKKPFYKIGEACKLLDVQPYVLRYWEREFPFLAAGETRGGQRVYSAEDVTVIRRIKTLLYEEGYTIAGAKRKLESELGDGGTAAGVAAAESAGAELAAELDEADAPAALPFPPPLVATATDAPGALDTAASERVETLLAGVRGALGLAREILRRLEAPRVRAREH